MVNDNRSTTIPVFGKITYQGPAPTLSKDKKVMMGISIKNRLFSKNLIDKFCKLVAVNNMEGLIAIFDVPYAYNDAAERGENEPTKKDLERNIRLGEERERMIEKVIRRNNTDQVKIVRWDKLICHSKHEALREEFYLASQTSEKFKEYLVSQVKSYIERYGSIKKNEVYERFFGFQLQELSVLVALYYEFGYLMDIYPGQNFPIFKKLESGYWEKELPLSSAICRRQEVTLINCLVGSRAATTI